MKIISKKILLLMCIAFCIAGVTACQADSRDVDYNGVAHEELLAQSQNYIHSLEALDDATKQQILMSSQQQELTDEDKMIFELIESYDEVKKDSGAFIDFDDFHVNKTGKTLTTELKVQMENRNIVISLVYNYNTMNLTGITVDPVYSTGEKMKLAGLNTLMGIGIVFIMLLFMSACISAFRIIPYLQSKRKNENLQPKVKETNLPVLEEANQEQDNLELVAVIAAAIASSTGQSTDDFVVRSIKRR